MIFIELKLKYVNLDKLFSQLYKIDYYDKSLYSISPINDFILVFALYKYYLKQKENYGLFSNA